MPTRWNLLGLSGDPFTPDPLEISEEDRKLFIGREQALNDLTTLAAEDRHSFQVIGGDVGVGKTSLCNIVQVYLYDPGTREETGLAEFGYEDRLLPSIRSVEIQSSRGRHLEERLTQHLANSMAFWAEPSLTGELKAEVDYWDARHVDVGGRAGGVTIAGGAGFHFGAAQTGHNPNYDPALSFRRLLDGLAAETPYAGAVFVIDNLDLVPWKVVQKALNNIRDAFLTQPGTHWFLVGGSDLGEKVAAEPRLRPFLSGEPIRIAPPSHQQFQRMVDARLEVFALPSVDPSGRHVLSGGYRDVVQAISHRYGERSAFLWQHRLAEKRFGRAARVALGKQHGKKAGGNGPLPLIPPRPAIGMGAIRATYAFTHGDLRASFGLLRRLLRQSETMHHVVGNGEQVGFDEMLNFILDDSTQQSPPIGLSPKQLKRLAAFYVTLGIGRSTVAMAELDPGSLQCKNRAGLASAFRSLERKGYLGMHKTGQGYEVRPTARLESLAISNRLDAALGRGGRANSPSAVAVARIQSGLGAT